MAFESPKPNKLWRLFYFYFLCEVVWNLYVMAQGSRLEQKTVCSIYWWIYPNRYDIHCSSYDDSSGLLLGKPRIIHAPNDAPERGCDYKIAHGFSTPFEWHAELWGKNLESKYHVYLTAWVSNIWETSLNLYRCSMKKIRETRSVARVSHLTQLPLPRDRSLNKYLPSSKIKDAQLEYKLMAYSWWPKK